MNHVLPQPEVALTFPIRPILRHQHHLSESINVSSSTLNIMQQGLYSGIQAYRGTHWACSNAKDATSERRAGDALPQPIQRQHGHRRNRLRFTSASRSLILRGEPA